MPETKAFIEDINDASR